MKANGRHTQDRIEATLLTWHHSIAKYADGKWAKGGKWAGVRVTN